MAALISVFLVGCHVVVLLLFLLFGDQKMLPHTGLGEMSSFQLSSESTDLCNQSSDLQKKNPLISVNCLPFFGLSHSTCSLQGSRNHSPSFGQELA